MNENCATLHDSSNQMKNSIQTKNWYLFTMFFSNNTGYTVILFFPPTIVNLAFEIVEETKD